MLSRFGNRNGLAKRVRHANVEAEFEFEVEVA